MKILPTKLHLSKKCRGFRVTQGFTGISHLQQCEKECFYKIVSQTNSVVLWMSFFFIIIIVCEKLLCGVRGYIKSICLKRLDEYPTFSYLGTRKFVRSQKSIRRRKIHHHPLWRYLISSLFLTTPNPQILNQRIKIALASLTSQIFSPESFSQIRIAKHVPRVSRAEWSSLFTRARLKKWLWMFSFKKRK